jgi:hypothetical protein
MVGGSKKWGFGLTVVCMYYYIYTRWTEVLECGELQYSALGVYMVFLFD